MIDEQGWGRISMAIVGVERKTSGEIFCVLTPRVSRYYDVALGWAAAAALILPLGLIPLGFESAWIPGMGSSWEAAHLAARELTTGQALAAYSMIQAMVFLAVFAVTSRPMLTPYVVPRAIRRTRARKAAMLQFLAHGLQHTQRRTGVLIFAAVADRQVEIIADEGIHAVVDDAVWGDAAQALARAMREGRIVEGYVEAIGLCGEVLTQHFPPRSHDVNELADRLVIV